MKSIRKEFEKFVEDRPDLILNRCNGCMKIVWSWISQKLKSEYERGRSSMLDEELEEAETRADIAQKNYSSGYNDCLKGRKKAPHDTRDGYCCACDYDIAVMKEKIKASYERGRKDGSPSIYSFPNADFKRGYGKGYRAKKRKIICKGNCNCPDCHEFARRFGKVPTPIGQTGLEDIGDIEGYLHKQHWGAGKSNKET